MKLWTRAEERDAVWWRRQGVKVSVIAKRLGRTKCSVAHRLSSLGVVACPWNRARRRAGGLRAAVRELARRGFTNQEMADRLGVSESAVSRTRSSLGLPRPGRADAARRGWSRRRLCDDPRIAELLADGHTHDDVAEILGIARRTVSKAAKMLAEVPT